MSKALLPIFLLILEICLECENAFQAIKQYVAQGPLLVDVLMHKPTTSAKNFVDALSAFWPGLQVSVTFFYFFPCGVCGHRFISVLPFLAALQSPILRVSLYLESHES